MKGENIPVIDGCIEDEFWKELPVCPLSLPQRWMEDGRVLRETGHAVFLVLTKHCMWRPNLMAPRFLLPVRKMVTIFTTGIAMKFLFILPDIRSTGKYGFHRLHCEVL
ncbi:MAG: hypothetical protein WC959_06820 [Kiritimatiellales bacterium]